MVNPLKGGHYVATMQAEEGALDASKGFSEDVNREYLIRGAEVFEGLG